MGKKRRGGRGLLVFLALAAAFAALLYDSGTRIVTDEFKIGNSRLPEGFEGFRVTHLSDLHATRFGEGNRELIEAVRGSDPDIIVITGDMVDGEGQQDYVRELIPALTAVAPVYYVTGNHEWASGWVHELFRLLEELGAVVLRNEYVLLERGGGRIVLAGVDDPNGPADQKTPEALVEEIRAAYPGEYILMLAHRDTELDMWASLGVDAVLCGHAHGGLIRLPFTDGLAAPGQGWFPTYTAGVYERGATQMLVSRGFTGSHGVPRFLNNPQVAVAVLTREKP